MLQLTETKSCNSAVLLLMLQQLDDLFVDLHIVLQSCAYAALQSKVGEHVAV